MKTFFDLLLSANFGGWPACVCSCKCESETPHLAGRTICKLPVKKCVVGAGIPQRAPEVPWSRQGGWGGFPKNITLSEVCALLAKESPEDEAALGRVEATSGQGSWGRSLPWRSD